MICNARPTTGGSARRMAATRPTSVMSTATATPTTTTRPTRMAWPSDSAARKGRSDKVTGNGEIIVGGIRVSIGFALRGWQVGLKPINGSNRYHVFLTDFLLGTLDMDFYCFYPLEELQSSCDKDKGGKP